MRCRKEDENPKPTLGRKKTPQDPIQKITESKKKGGSMAQVV
jgi:hypothetical protein